LFAGERDRRFEDVRDLRNAVQRAFERGENLDFRKQQQDDLNEYRRLMAGNAAQNAGIRADAAQAAADARAEAATARRDSQRRTETDRTRREYEGARTKLGAATAAAQNVMQLANDPALANNPSAQTALVFAFGRMLDPTSVVREGEFKLFESGRGVLDTLGNFAERVQSGARLTPAQVRNMATVANGILQRQGALEATLGSRYHSLAKQRGYDPYEVVGAFDPAAQSAPSSSSSQAAPAYRYDASGRRVR
jgi:hypothetical protein